MENSDIHDEHVGHFYRSHTIIVGEPNIGQNGSFFKWNDLSLAIALKFKIIIEYWLFYFYIFVKICCHYTEYGFRDIYYANNMLP